MNGSHVAGGGLGALLGVIIASLGTRIGITLDDATAATVGAAGAAVGAALGHAIGKAWSGPGVFPSLRRGFFGIKKPAEPSSEPVAPAG